MCIRRINKSEMKINNKHHRKTSEESQLCYPGSLVLFLYVVSSAQPSAQLCWLDYQVYRPFDSALKNYKISVVLAWRFHLLYW